MTTNDDKEGWWPEITLVVGVAALTAALAAGFFLDLDVAVRDWSDAHRPPLLDALARNLNHVGSANLLAAILLALAVPLIVRTRSARPLLPIVVTYGLSHVLIAPVKIFVDRAAPHAPAVDAVELFADPDGWSYPSGHVANTLIWFPLLLAYLDVNLRAVGRGEVREPGRSALLVAPPVIVTGTVTYLGYHWVTDSVAAVLIGFLLLRLLRRIPWAAVRPVPAMVNTTLQESGPR